MAASARQIDQNPLKGLGWIGGGGALPKPPAAMEPSAASPLAAEVPKPGTSEVPKPDVTTQPKESTDSPGLNARERAWAPRFEACELTVPFHAEQVERLEALARKIMRGRGRGHRAERITKNTIVRAWVEVLASLSIDTTNVCDETELLSRFRRAIGGQGIQ